jgi:hypothetical protein
MARSTFVASYRIGVKPRTAPARNLSFRRVDTFKGAEGDLLEWCHDTLRSWTNEAIVDKEDGVYIKTQELYQSERVLSGRFTVGEYGFPRDLVDTEQLTQPAVPLEVTKAVCERFYYRVFMPPGKRMGLLLLQRSGNIGVVSRVREVLRDKFQKAHPDLTLWIDPLVPAELVAQLNKHESTRLDAVYLRAPTDASDKDRWGGAVQGYSQVVVTFKAPPKEYLKLAFKGTAQGLVLPDLGRPNSVRVKVDYKGRPRTLTYEAPERVSPWIDVTKDVKHHAGEVLFTSIDEFCSTWQDELADQLELKDDN